MVYTWSNLTPIKDGSGNITAFRLYYAGNNATTGDNVSGSVQITLDQFSSTAGKVDAITALIAPAVQAAVTA
ncbi:hypothetical protein OYT88_04535 [Sporolactobacillus sp. CQH2019]|uniref:hypothetical protein n=1 Tax=Sporolactobacillus sp. CQH2019 TaxID=3023512 RepID=UPI0023683CB4|nr:hypothetical protein [Sporolactobacillus sp. CQH2019]MDD9147816.1 hypothetical protein [Sporolactobacillus sp. CQH2019]